MPGNPTVKFYGVCVPPLIVAGGAYPSRRCGECDPRRRLFDYRLSRACNVVECAFGRLISQWRCLSASLPVSAMNAVPIITACVVLHNICDEMEDTLKG